MHENSSKAPLDSEPARFGSPEVAHIARIAVHIWRQRTGPDENKNWVLVIVPPASLKAANAIQMQVQGFCFSTNTVP